MKNKLWTARFPEIDHLPKEEQIELLNKCLGNEVFQRQNRRAMAWTPWVLIPLAVLYFFGPFELVSARIWHVLFFVALFAVVFIGMFLASRLQIVRLRKLVRTELAKRTDLTK